MGKTADNGGPAFPHHRVEYVGGWEDRTELAGMTLRDWFAGQALGAVIVATSMGQHDPCTKHGKGVEASIALDAYALADAMLEARK